MHHRWCVEEALGVLVEHATGEKIIGRARAGASWTRRAWGSMVLIRTEPTGAAAEGWISRPAAGQRAGGEAGSTSVGRSCAVSWTVAPDRPETSPTHARRPGSVELELWR